MRSEETEWKSDELGFPIKRLQGPEKINKTKKTNLQFTTDKMASFNLIEQIAKNQSNELRQLQTQRDLNAAAANMNGTSDSAAEMAVY